MGNFAPPDYSILYGFFTLTLALVLVAVVGAPIALLLAKSWTGCARLTVWLGIAVLLIYTMVAGLFAPLRSGSAIIGLVVVLLALWMVLVVARHKISLSRDVVRLGSLGWLVIFALVVAQVWWLVVAMKAPTNYDSGLYHIPQIWYAADFGTIPGLSNLYLSLGFGNSIAPLGGVFANLPLGYEAYRIIIPLFFLLLSVELIARLAGSARQIPGTRVLLVASAIFVPAMVWMADYWVISPTFDTPVAILVIVSAAALMDLLRTERATTADLSVVLIPLAVASSMRPYFWFVFALTFVIALRRVRSIRPFVFPSVLASALLIAGIARDYLLSGWVLYPFKIFSFNVDWLAPDPTALTDATKQWARLPGPNYQSAQTGYDWVIPWLGANVRTWLGAVILALFLGCLILLFINWRDRISVGWKIPLLVLAPQIAMLLVWFFLGGPHLRYVWGPIILVGAIPFAWLWFHSRFGIGWGESVFVLGSVAAVIASAILVYPNLSESVPNVKVQLVPVGNGQFIQMPPADDQCWYAYPWCSGMPTPGLTVRGDSLESGFTHGN